MAAKSPEETCNLFRRYMSQGDIEGLLSIYDPEAVFLNRAGEVQQGRECLKPELAPMAAAKTALDFKIRQVVQTGGIALMHTEWTMYAPAERKVCAIELARRQPDGTWCWLIGDPFTECKRKAARKRRVRKSG